jgi:signal transduction histidine kinase
MTLRARLILTIAGIALLLVLPAAYALVGLRQLTDIAEGVSDRHSVAYEASGRLQTRLVEIDRLATTYIANSTDDSRDGMFISVDSARARLGQLREADYDSVANEVGARIDSIAAALLQVDSLMVFAAAATDETEAIARKERATDYYQMVTPLIDRTEEAVNAIGFLVEQRSREDINRAGGIAQGATTRTIIALLICITIAIGLGIWTTRALTRPVMQLRHAMALVADGIFRVPENLPYERQDEIGSVSRSFRAMTHRLADLDQMKAEFMSISTHELKTPINVISGYAELMYERVYGDLSDRQEEALTAIREQTRVLTQLVNQLLDVSRLEAGGLRVHFRPVSVHDLFSRVERSFEGLAHRKQITLTVEVDPSAPETMDADADRLSDQVLGNLLSNALKFTPEGGRIMVRAWPDRDALRIEVEDTGTGIPPDKLPYIFNKFYQVGEHARAKGAGLGLAIAHEVIEAHHGSIHAESEPDRGTHFHITLPLHQQVVEESIIAGPIHVGEPR